MRERDVHAHLVKRVKAHGGEVRRVKWIGRSNAPDVLVLLPDTLEHFYVEEKRPGKAAEAAQAREHERMRAAGMRVHVLTTPEEIDRVLPPPTKTKGNK